MGFLSKILSRDESDEDVLQEAAALAVAEARVDESALDDDDDLDLMDIFAEEVAEVDANVKKLGGAVDDADLGELMEDIREVMGLW
jgi:hypothetical protein